jgi:DNA-directed RNA polymerase subunit RPC12/RpoP
MSSADGPARLRGRQLLRCPRCGSHLIYARDAGGGDALVVFDRRCPECEHRDSVVVSARAADVWSRHQQRIRAKLERVANELAGRGASEPSDDVSPR